MGTTKPISEGARKLRRYLNAEGLSVPDFCEAHGLDRIRVQRYLKGDRTHATVDFAEAIEKATKGEVPWSAWHTRTLRATTPEPARRRTGTTG